MKGEAMERQTVWRHGLFAAVLMVAVVAIIIAAVTDDRGGFKQSHFMGDRVTLSGETDSQLRTVELFDRITLRGGYELELTAGEEQSVTLTGDTALLKITETRVKDGELFVGPANNVGVRTYDNFELRIALPTLRGLTVDGAVDGTLAALDSDRIEIVVNGAAQIEADGRCGLLEVETNGAGKIDAQALECRTVRLETNGAGSASVYASEFAEIVINGVGNVDLYGNPPDMRTEKSGLGNITVHDNDNDSENGDEDA